VDRLIPEAVFVWAAGISIWLIFGLLVVSFAVLCKGADWFVDGSAGAAIKLGVPKIIIGATIVSIGTTSSEATISVMAALAGQPGLALGNGIGSVICNIGLIFGLSCCITRIPVDRFILKRQGWVHFGSVFAFVIICYILLLFGTRHISRLFGIIMVAILLGYVLISLYWSKQHQGDVAGPILDVKGSIPKMIILFIIGLALVLIGSRVLLGSVNQICIKYNVPPAVIAATLVAFGTSLPELATAVASIIKGHKEILLGNIIGANILNILFVIGVSALPKGLNVGSIMYSLNFPAMAIIVLMFTFFGIISRKQYHRLLGIPLLAVYVIYIMLQYLNRAANTA
jgi:cation:H+ antiporter